MKKTLIMAALALACSAAVSAQERTSEEERTKATSERIEKSAERMAKEFGLKDDAKETFTRTYSAYQQEMFATNQLQGKRLQRENGEGEEKKLTDEEATAKIQESLDRQEQQIQTLQKRLEVQKKYAAELGKVLTPQQVLKVLTPQRGQGGRGQGQRGNNGDGERRGGFDGGSRGGFGGGPRGGFGGPGF